LPQADADVATEGWDEKLWGNHAVGYTARECTECQRTPYQLGAGTVNSVRRVTRPQGHRPRRDKPQTNGSGAQLGRHFLTEEAYGIVEAIWAYQATHVRLHEDARKAQLIP
jgi:hypothetical protein